MLERARIAGAETSETLRDAPAFIRKSMKRNRPAALDERGPGVIRARRQQRGERFGHHVRSKINRQEKFLSR